MLNETGFLIGDFVEGEEAIGGAPLVYRASNVTSHEVRGSDAVLKVRFKPLDRKDAQDIEREVLVRSYDNSIVRLGMNTDAVSCAFDDSSISLSFDKSLIIDQLQINETDTTIEVKDSNGDTRLLIDKTPPKTKRWSELMPPAEQLLKFTVYPKPGQPVRFNDNDTFFPEHVDSVGLGFTVKGNGKSPEYSGLFSVHAELNERFVGTGERFSKMDLSGKTLQLMNADGFGSNSRRTYKNVPFYISSKPYGLYINTSAITHLSLADVCTRAAQARIMDTNLDLFVIGGDTPNDILFNYRKVTGHPPAVPTWSYGIWMSRMTYYTANEVDGVAQRLREEDLPCDVLHVDTGWFPKDWICEWRFSETTFPDPDKFMDSLLERGYRLTVWQTPSVNSHAELYPLAKEKEYLPPTVNTDKKSASDFGTFENNEQIDFTSPKAYDWYQNDLLRPLLEQGVACIKTDFGEEINMLSTYKGMDAKLLRNCYAVMYQKAAFDVTQEVHGYGLTWSRAGWAGSQRYPVHWAGDSACTWDGMAGALRGGLHLAMSGFAYWSHDVPGFHGLPDFMSSWPSEKLYLRWTQFAVFCSHFRYHGTSPREPYEYPGVLDDVRKYFKLRYALLPYIIDEAQASLETGSAVCAPMLMHAPDDPTCWTLDDQFFCGRDILVAPIMNEENKRDIYLPAGEWIDLFSGERLEGARWLLGVQAPMSQIPVYVRANANIRVYAEKVDSTNDMDMSKAEELQFDESYTGIADSVLGPITGLLPRP